jgi:hypothetical protein
MSTERSGSPGGGHLRRRDSDGVLAKLGTLPPRNEVPAFARILKKSLSCTGPVFVAERK